MPKRRSKSTSRRSKPAKRRRPPSAVSVLLLWPFHLFALFTRRFQQPKRFLIRAAGFPAIAGLYVFTILALVYGFRSHPFDLAKIHAMPERTIIRDRLGEEIGRIHGEKRSIVPLRHVSENFRKAILAREDERFYRHGAFDLIGIARAALKNMEGKREGASTITQQLVADVFQLKRGEKRGDVLKQIDRKFLEIAIAIRLEATLEKDEILEAYINQINWGRQIKGIGEASRIYFEKHPAELSLSEGALLAGIVRGPDAYNPFRSMKAATRERNTTLARMVDAEEITQAQADKAKQEPIEIRPQWRRQYKESFAMDAIRQDLEIILNEENIELGGLEIITTIDKRIQQKTEEALEAKLASLEKSPGYQHTTRAAWNKLPKDNRPLPNYVQGAAVVIENRTGGVLAVVGGRDANESRFNRAKNAKRQLGSIFKPFVYLSAFEKGLGPSTPISDGSLQPGEIRGGGTWRPRNSDGTFGGLHPASYGLIRSRNTMSVRVGNYAGIRNVKETAKRVGFATPMPANPSSFLGSWEGSPWEVASAYAIFPNGGTCFRPFLISQIKDRDGNILYSGLPIDCQAASSSPAKSVSRVLEEVTDRGTAASVRRLGFDKPCGGKTGTTNAYRDAWFSGFTSQLTCAVWVGFDKPKTTVNRGFGSTLALPVWVDVMKTADRLGYKAVAINSNRRVVSMRICRLSGKRATSGCESEGTAVSVAVSPDAVLPPHDTCPLHPAKALAVDGNAKAQPVDETPPRAQAIREPRTPPRASPVRERAPRAVPVIPD